MAYVQSPIRKNPVLRVLVTCVAIVCLVLGAISLPLPLPTGAILLAIGFALLLTVSRRAKVWFRSYRRRSPWIDGKLMLVERYLPDMLRQALSGRPKRNI